LVELRDGVVKPRELFLRAVVGRLARFNVVGELLVIERHGRTAAGRAPADEADRSVDGNPVKPGVCMSVLFQARQSPPDLKQDFLIQVVPVGGVPRINTADL